MAPKADGSCVLERASCDWRLLKVKVIPPQINKMFSKSEMDLKNDFSTSDGPGGNEVATPGGGVAEGEGRAG